MDFISDFVINLLAHRTGVRVLRLFTGGRFQGESGFAFGIAALVGILVLLAPVAVFIAWLIVSRS